MKNRDSMNNEEGTYKRQYQDSLTAWYPVQILPTGRAQRMEQAERTLCRVVTNLSSKTRTGLSRRMATR